MSAHDRSFAVDIPTRRTMPGWIKDDRTADVYKTAYMQVLKFPCTRDMTIQEALTAADVYATARATAALFASNALRDMLRQNADINSLVANLTESGPDKIDRASVQSAILSHTGQLLPPDAIDVVIDDLKGIPSDAIGLNKLHEAAKEIREGQTFASAKLTKEKSVFQTSEKRADTLAQLFELSDDAEDGKPALVLIREYLMARHTQGSAERTDKFLQYLRLMFESQFDSDEHVSPATNVTSARFFAETHGLLDPADKDDNKGNKADAKAKTMAARLCSLAATTAELAGVTSYMDVGCGDGTVTAATATTLGVAPTAAFGLDIGESMGAVLKGSFTHILFQGHELPDTIADGSIDMASTIHVLHHTGDNLVPLLRSIRKKLSKNGVFVVKEHDCPNAAYGLYLDVIHTLKQRVFFPSEPEHMPNAVYRSKSEWHCIFKENGFMLVDAEEQAEVDRISSEAQDRYRSFYTVLRVDPSFGVDNPKKKQRVGESSVGGFARWHCANC